MDSKLFLARRMGQGTDGTEAGVKRSGDTTGTDTELT